MHQVAQTNIQLYNQLIAQGRSIDDMRLVRAAYDVSSQLTSGYFQGDGKPFVCHSVGVASILGLIGAPARFVAFGLLHNIYINGDFGDGLQSPLTADKREFVRQRVSTEVEALIMRFRDLRVSAASIERLEAGLSRFDDTERLLIAADLADHMEKYVDAGVLYFGDGSWITCQTDAHGQRLIALADKLGQPTLAQMMREAFTALDGKGPMPEAVRPPRHRRYLALTVPLSTRPRWLPRLRRRLRRHLQTWRSRLKRLARAITMPPVAARSAGPLQGRSAPER